MTISTTERRTASSRVVTAAELRDDARHVAASHATGELLINFGCGKQHLRGFVNVDLEPPCDVRADARRPLPFAERSARGIYSEHFLEHLTQTDGMRFLRECRRVLRPGGRLRIAMPDLAVLVDRYRAEDWRGDGDMFRLGFDWVQNRCEMLNTALREWGHLWVYDEEELRRLARLAGLHEIGRCERGESDWPEFRGVETRPGSRLVMEFERRSTAPVDEEPLVSVLVPAYNPRFFGEALRSALEQTWRRLEIVICDDDSTGGVEAMVRSIGRDPRVRYLRNETRQGGMGNYLRCLEVAEGELVKFLNDDDLLAPSCVERMVDAFRRFEGARLVTSRRRCIDEHGAPARALRATRPLATQDTVFAGASLAHATLRLGVNLIGEPTTTMFRREDLSFVTPHFMSFGGAVAVGAGDVAAWLNLLSQGDLVFLAETCSYLRLHPEQRQRDPEIHAAGLESWRQLVHHGRRLGLLDGGPGWWVAARQEDDRGWSRRLVATPGDLTRQARGLARRAARRLGR